MARWLYGLGQGAARLRWVVVGIWLTLIITVAALGTAFGGTLTSEITIPGIESQNANDLLAEQFPSANTGTIRAVFAAPDGMTLADTEAQAAITASLAEAGTVAGVLATTPLTTSENGTIGFADVIFVDTAELVTDDAREAVLASMNPAEAAGLRVEYGGTAMSTFSELGHTAEIIGVIIAAIVLFITLRTLIGAGLPLGTAFVGVAFSMLGVLILARFASLPETTSALSTMLGLAVGIDYALFIVSRHREQLADPKVSVSESIGRALGTAGSAVVFAGLTVIIALCALAAVQIPFLTAMGLAAAATVALAVIVALTLLPAALAFAGERLRPRSKHEREIAAGEQDPKHPTFWGRWGQLIERAPGAVLIVGTVLLLVASLPVLNLRLGLPSNETQPESSTLRQSYELLTEGFGQGFNATIIYVVDATDIAAGERANVAIQVAESIRTDANVAAVSDPTFNADETVAILSVVPLGGPDDQSTTDLVERLRNGPAELVEGAGGDAYVTGITAVGIDISAKLGAALPLFIGIIVVLALVLLLLAFRSIIVPIKAVAGFLLTIGSSMGLTVLVFQQGHFASLFGVANAAPIVSFMPILLIGILFGLAMDYEVFLVSRMREHFHHSDDATEAVVGGLGQSGRVVAAAALIMTAVFGGFMFTPEPVLKSIAFALAVGVMIDAFIVRMTLVPAAMLLLGRRAWSLPTWLDRRLPNVDIEGASLPQVTHGAAGHAGNTDPHGATSPSLPAFGPARPETVSEPVRVRAD